ncbi:hypothetical protein AMATHDRAFT_140673 [Amanita thiersii Skay4041]|uniref:Exonuclease domain-containing protein n=1 Tax=Amanita thiersii Skay4041 TaxID=703135 RepID=A0A2A9NNJ2_9AGAR|nr:hypothetical protein AMATHDRAFT_140673 [Amanita thiersii Skay4041]
MSQDSPPSNAVPFNYQAGPLVWIDCEMTGLDPQTDRLLEIAVIVTNGNLQRVDSGINYVIRTNKTVLDSMDPWCINQHGQSGLTQACLSSPHSLDYVSSEVLAYIKKWIPDRSTGVLAGNTVYMDRLFLAKEMPEVVDWLHYRIVDVSSIKELVRRWYTGKIAPKFGDNGHRALDDIECSIKELQWYKDNIFVQQSLVCNTCD